MKLSFALFVGLAVAAPTLGGCAAGDIEREGAEYPEPAPLAPVGYDAPETSATSSAALEAPTPAVPASDPFSAASVPGSTQESELHAQGDVAVGESSTQYEDTDPSALTDFRPALDPYGSWVDDPTYGTVWSPSPTVVGSDFAPYVSGGHWTYDDATNWVWVSDYDWGWAPFHYGRWVYLRDRWGWIPGREYSGAWVSWRYGYDGWGYLGWAPLAPTWYWRGGYAFGLGFAAPLPWVFCGYDNVFQHNVGTHIVAGPQVANVAAHTRVYANPAVAGSGHTPAHPTVGGGPSPLQLHIPPNQIAHVPAGDRGVIHARQYANPGTATGLGARPPSMTSGLATHAFASPSTAHLGPSRPTSLGTMPSYPTYRSGGAVASGPHYQGVPPSTYHGTPYYGQGGTRSLGTLPSYGGYQAPRYGSPYGGGTYGGAAGGFGSRPFGSGGYGGLGIAHPGGGMGPVYGGGQYGSAYHGGGGHPSSSSSSSTPEEGGPPVVHGGGGYGGGFHGGFRGGGGGGHAGGGHR